jgi:cell division protein FtsB
MADNMTKILYPLLLALAFLSSAGAATADDSKELRKQRQAAQKECQQQKNEHAAMRCLT